MSSGGTYAEFQKDLGQCGTIRKLIRNSLVRGSPLNRELIVNKVIMTGNSFGPKFAAELLHFFITDPDELEIIDDVLRELAYI